MKHFHRIKLFASMFLLGMSTMAFARVTGSKQASPQNVMQKHPGKFQHQRQPFGVKHNSSPGIKNRMSLSSPSSMLDSTFGTNGSVSNFISGGGSTIDIANSIAIQSDGKIVAGGVFF